MPWALLDESLRQGTSVHQCTTNVGKGCPHPTDTHSLASLRYHYQYFSRFLSAYPSFDTFRCDAYNKDQSGYKDSWELCFQTLEDSFIWRESWIYSRTCLWESKLSVFILSCEGTGW